MKFNVLISIFMISLFTQAGNVLAQSSIPSESAITYTKSLVSNLTLGQKITKALGEKSSFFSEVKFYEHNNKISLKLDQVGFWNINMAKGAALAWGKKLGLTNVKAYPSLYADSGELSGVSMSGEITEEFVAILKKN